MYRRLLALLLMSLAAWPASPRTALEVELASQVETGQPAWLEAQDQEFLALYTEPTIPSRQGGAIILADQGHHPAWPQVVNPLRKRLANHGWTTLAMALPAADDNPTLVSAASSRLQAAIAYLQEQGVENIALLGHGLSGAVSAAFIANQPDAGINAFVGINLTRRGHTDAELDLTAQLPAIEIPILDIYGARAQRATVTGAKARSTAVRKGGGAQSKYRLRARQGSTRARIPFSDHTGYIAYRQQKIPGADHQFTGLAEVLTKRIAGWLRNHAVGTEISVSR